MDGLVANTLRRIRQIIAESVRSYESTSDIHESQLTSADLNLRRIASQISTDTYRTLSDAINGLLLLANNSNTDKQSYSAPRVNLPGKGRPVVHITEGQLKLLYNEGFPASSMAKQFSCSKSTIYKKLYVLNLPMRGRYTDISSENLENKIREIHQDHPNAGHVMMDSYLKAEKIFVPRQRIRQILNDIDPIGTASRWSKTIKRRVYKVPTPNSLWHIDAHLKLSRWGFVVHGCIDGFSRMIIYLKCETSIQPEPVLNLFSSAIKDFGFPSRVRSDHGYENLLVAVLVNLIRGLNRGSHITGKSTHNQRIERLWVDVIKEVCDTVRSEIYSLEEERQLDPDNLIHRFCIQYVYKSVINMKLSSFQEAWNVHKIRTEKNKSPRQLWLEGVLSSCNSNSVAITYVFEQNNDLNEQVTEALQALGVQTNIIHNDDLESQPSRFEAILELTDTQKQHLENIISEVKPARQKYTECVNYLL